MAKAFCVKCEIMWDIQHPKIQNELKNDTIDVLGLCVKCWNPLKANIIREEGKIILFVDRWFSWFFAHLCNKVKAVSGAAGPFQARNWQNLL